MTSIAVILSKDSRDYCSLYFLTDSQVSYSNSTKKIGTCKKVFISESTPDIFCFAGAIEPSMLLINDFLKYLAKDKKTDYNAQARHSALIDLSRTKMSTICNDTYFEIIHGMRDCKLNSKFYCWKTKYLYNKNGKFDKLEDILIPSEVSNVNPENGSGSELIYASGSGGENIIDEKIRLINNERYKSTRFLYMSVLSAISSYIDKSTSGPPQLVGLRRENNGMQFGLEWKNKLYICDKQYELNSEIKKLNCFNEKFERIDPITRCKLEGTQTHSPLKGIYT